MKRFFLSVFAITLGVLFFVTALGSAWWYYANRAPDITAELTGYNVSEYEEKLHWHLNFRINNADSKDYSAQGWTMRIYDRQGDLAPLEFALENIFSPVLIANERTGISFRTGLTADEKLFRPELDMELSISRADAEAYLNNLNVFRERFWFDDALLINDTLGFRQKISIAEFYKSELERRQRILARQGEPVDHPE